jgi:2-hydroxycyclohexanecarboxyl-CoA dehydrogenase
MTDDALPQPLALDEMRCLIVGGTSGIGLATARMLAEAGAPGIVIAGRSAARGAAALEKLGHHPAISFVAGDGSSPTGATELVAAAQASLGAIDAVVCTTAPAVLPDLIHRTPIDGISAILNDLALPPLLVTVAVLPALRAARRGVIVTVASDAGKTPTPGEAVIGAGMAAISMFTRTVAMEAKRDGIRANVVTPSLVNGTETSARILEGGFSAKLFQKAGEMASLGVAEADDIAALIVYLLGPQARRLTGQQISVNGGISAM